MDYRWTGTQMMIQAKGRRVSMQVTNYRHKVTNYRHTLKTEIKLRMEMRKVEEWHKNK